MPASASCKAPWSSWRRFDRIWSSGDLDGEVSPRQVPDVRDGGLHGGHGEGVRVVGKQAEALDVSGPEGVRLPDEGWAGLSAGDLKADGQIAGQEPEADRDPIRVEPIDELVPTPRQDAHSPALALT